MLKKYLLDEYLKKLGVNLPNEGKFEKLIDELSYFKSSVGDNEIINFNYERGYILYSLVAHLKPKNILEYGTAQGFGTLCMAWAMNDFGIDGKIHTIDYVTHDQKFLQYFKKSEKINQRITSRRKLWKGLAEKSWTDKIQVLSGYTANIVANKKLPPIDFFFIDGPHFYRGFKHDFMSSILLSNSNPFFLFDDYIDRPDYGVKKLVDKELINKFKTTLIKNDQSERPIRNGITKSDYGMCTLEASKNELIDNFGLNNIKNYLKEYKHYENRLKLRNVLNKKIPFLKNIRFSKIFKPKI